MITFLQESKFNKNSFLHLENSKKASHFRKDGGQITKILKLQTSNRQQHNPSTEEPLIAPTMNFGEEKQQPESDVLIAPSTF